jgi:hypothetical protein
MRVRSLKNLMHENVTVRLKGGTTVSVPKNSEIRNIEVEDGSVDDLKECGGIELTCDLSEINESGGKTKLND